MINRTEALLLLQKYVHQTDAIRHSLLVEAIMISTANFLGKDTDLWGLVGLLHDLDYEYIRDQPENHGTVTAKLVKELIPEKGIHAILAHNYLHTHIIPTARLDKALLASDSLSTLLTSYEHHASPNHLKKLSVSSLKNYFNNHSTTQDHIRSKILLCEDIGIELDTFLYLAIQSRRKNPLQITE